MPNPSSRWLSRRTLVVPGAAALLLAALSSASARPRPAVADYRITALRARLFNADSATFSRDILREPRPALWNTIIGEGDAGGPSSSVLVVVQVTGEAGSYEDARRVELTARTQRRVLLRDTSELHVLNSSGRTFVGFWLSGVGCEPVRLQARLLGQAQPSARSAEIPFECGE